MKRNGWIATAAVAVIAMVLIWFAVSPAEASVLDGKSAVVHKGDSCGCCNVYVGYAEKTMAVQVLNNGEAIKNQYNIPTDLRSCHTTVVDGYFVEGHMPLEAIEKLVTEKPDIAGIALAGMPYGSPGMPGAKQGPFIVYAVNKDGTYQEYMRI
jgi:hypothetical protein